MQQNKHLMKGSEGRNVFSSLILSRRNKAAQYKTPIQCKMGTKAQDEEKSISEEEEAPG